MEHQAVRVKGQYQVSKRKAVLTTGLLGWPRDSIQVFLLHVKLTNFLVRPI